MAGAGKETERPAPNGLLFDGQGTHRLRSGTLQEMLSYLLGNGVHSANLDIDVEAR